MFGRGFSQIVRQCPSANDSTATRSGQRFHRHGACHGTAWRWSICCLVLVSACAVPPSRKDGSHDDIPFSRTALEPVPTTTATAAALPADSPSGAFPVVQAAATEPLPVQPMQAKPLQAQTPIRFDDGSSSEDVGGPTAGQREMTLDGVLQFALANHPLLQSRQFEVAAARARLVTAGLLTNPNLVINTETPVARADTTELSGRVVFTIPTAGKRWRRQAVARAAVRRSQMTLARETESVLREAADAATEVIYLQDLVRLNAQLEQLAQQRAAAPNLPLGNGTTQLDVLSRVRADIGTVNARTRLLDTKSKLAAARARLGRAIGLAADVQVTMRENIQNNSRPLLPLESVLAMARENNPRLAEACAALSESRHQHDLALAESLPDLRVGPRYRAELGGLGDGVGGRFRTDLPLFDRNQGNILETGAQTQSRRALVRAAQLQSLHDVAAAYTELQTIRESLDDYETKGAKLIQRNQTLLNDPRVQQLMTPDQLLSVRQDLLGIRIDQLRLRYRYQQLLTQLEILLGGRITVGVGEGVPQA